eukprot:3406882-Lingulodinium_polyedra.AAC.1
MAPGAPKGIAALPKGDPMDALRMGAFKAFWQLPETWVDDLAYKRKVKVQGSLAEQFGLVIQSMLGEPAPAVLLDILARRAFPEFSSWG